MGSLVAGQTYHFRIKAINAEGSSAYSNVASVTTVSGAPTAPSGITAGSNGWGVEVMWSDDSSDETGFILERSTSSSSGFVQITTLNPGETFYVDSTGTSGTVYFYRVKAVKTGFPDSAYSSVASGMMP